MTDAQTDTTTSSASDVEALTAHICAKMLGIAEEHRFSPAELGRRLVDDIEFLPMEYGISLIALGHGSISRRGAISGLVVCTLLEKVEVEPPSADQDPQVLKVHRTGLAIELSVSVIDALEAAFHVYFDELETSASVSQWKEAGETIRDYLQSKGFFLMRASPCNHWDLLKSDIVRHFANATRPLLAMNGVESELLSYMEFPRLTFDGNPPEELGQTEEEKLAALSRRKRAILTMDLAWILGDVCMLVSVSRVSPDAIVPYKLLVGVDGLSVEEVMNFFESINFSWSTTDDPFGCRPVAPAQTSALFKTANAISKAAWSVVGAVDEVREKLMLEEFNAGVDDIPVPADPVNAPAHYRTADHAYEPINVIEAWKLDFCLGNSVKYIARAGKKDPDKYIEDLQKAIWYINRRIYQLENGIG